MAVELRETTVEDISIMSTEAAAIGKSILILIVEAAIMGWAVV